MDARLIDRIETSAEGLASALFAAAVGYAVYSLLAPVIPEPGPGIAAGIAALTACLASWRGLKAAARQDPRFAIPIFNVREIDGFYTADELLLTDADRLNDELLLTAADRVDAIERAGSELLELDDILAELGPDARVVRLFDPQAMPTAGEIKSRIDSHIEKGAMAPADDSQALFAALAELRQSLR
jgi:hypothetical protein